jgi:hypothetical protein
MLGGALGFASPIEYFPKARAAAERALELDGTLADAHAVLAGVRLKFDWIGMPRRGNFNKSSN